VLIAEEGIIKHMLKMGLLFTTKFVLITLVSIISINVSHFAPTSAVAPTTINTSSRNTQQSVQCQSPCPPTILVEREDKLLKVKENHKDPIPRSYHSYISPDSLLASLFTLKRSASFASSWQPPNLLKLYGNYILYA
jgi:Na+-transporting methylmalonyl-CoA/oxaloacetate decarboxylase gamma subunit